MESKCAYPKYVWCVDKGDGAPKSENPENSAANPKKPNNRLSSTRTSRIPSYRRAQALKDEIHQQKSAQIEVKNFSCDRPVHRASANAANAKG